MCDKHERQHNPVAGASNNEGVTRVPSLLYLFLIAGNAYPFARLTPEAAGAFDRYVETEEAQMNRDLAAERFLLIDAKREQRARLRGGEVVIEAGASSSGSDEVKIPGGMIQDWVGSMFIPGATLTQVKALLQDYEKYREFYKPEVIESKLLGRSGDEYDVFLRLYKKQVLTVVLNTNYHVRYGMLDAHRMQVESHSTRIAEVKDHKRSYTEEEPVGHDTGFLWRLNSYWRFEEADGGVYEQCRAISLSRDVPLGLGWMIKGFIAKFPKESMQNTLRGTKAAVLSQSSLGASERK